MTQLKFSQLLNIYRHVAFDPEGEGGKLHLSDQSVLDDLLLIEKDAQASRDADVVCLDDDPEGLKVGQHARVRIGTPRVGLGLLVRSLDDLLNAGNARLAEPPAYFIKDGAFEKNSQPPTSNILRYRKAIQLANLFGEASSYLDQSKQELVFIRGRRISIPVRYDVAALDRMSLEAADGLLADLADDVHRDQKLAILGEAILHIAEPQAVEARFRHLLANLDAIRDELRDGYKLFASSFSYSKIRNDVEAARLDYIAKIHKTIVDIQGQLLGIPIATIIVGSQLKKVSACGVELWANLAIAGGAWIFVGLLLIAILNQWATLNVITGDIKRQRLKIQKEYSNISGQFVEIFDGLDVRARWHKSGLALIAAIGLLGALFASFVFVRLNDADVWVCLGL